MLKRTLQRLLGSLARAVIRKYRPKIIAITGSVGKTTTRAACVAVLSTRFRVRGSDKNYNNELGVPITILGCDAPGRSPFAWLGIFLKGLWLLFENDALYPQVLVLEMGADHPGDLAYLISIAPPDIGVVTAVSAAHTEFFSSIDGVLAEKKIVVTSLDADKAAVINADDEQLNKIVEEIRAPVVSYGFSDNASVHGREVMVRYDAEGRPEGMEAQMLLDGQEIGLMVPRALGRPVIYSALAAAAVGRAMLLDVAEIQLGLATFDPPAGRMRIIDGVKRTTLIDDTYNASPRAAREALDILAQVRSGGRRVAVLGDMLELGALTEEAHREIGRHAAQLGVNLLITVGVAAHFIADEARAAGLDESAVFSFDASPEAGVFLQDRMHEGDVILIKGSQGVRCEKIVKEVMAEPLCAEKMLVRQGAGWV